ncbi:MAG: hypothetical protein LW847_07140 [Burkholderiales bacterium]|nr:hypothetical protein [Burkholderiales bacterium]
MEHRPHFVVIVGQNVAREVEHQGLAEIEFALVGHAQIVLAVEVGRQRFVVGGVAGGVMDAAVAAVDVRGGVQQLARGNPLEGVPQVAVGDGGR